MHAPRLPLLRCGTVLAVLTLLWVAMSLWNFPLPGLYFDEVNHYAFIPGVLSDEAARLHHYRLPDNWLDLADGRRRFPILGGTIYNTVLRTYLGLPFFLVTGFSVEALRVFSALIGLAALLASTSLVGRIFGWLPALLFGLVIATDPTNVFSLRAQGGLFWLLIVFCSIAGHALLVAWRRRELPPWWTPIVAGAAIALAVASYFVGAFVALPLVICGIVVFRRHPGKLAVFLAAGIIAYLPVIYALASIHFHSPQRLANFGHPSLVRERPPLFGPDNLARVTGRLRGAWGSFSFAGNVVGRKFGEAVPWRFAALVAAGLGWGWLLASRVRPRGPQGALLAVIAVACGLYVAGLFWLTSLNLHHLIPLSVMVVMATACLVAFPGVPRAAGSIALVLLLATNAIALPAAHQKVRETGGSRYHNEVYAQPVTLLSDYPGYYPVFAGWGFHLQFLFLTRGERPYAFMRKPDHARIGRLNARHGRLAVFVGNGHREAFLQAFSPEAELEVRQRNGRPAYSVFFLASPEAGEATGKAARAGTRPTAPDPAARAHRDPPAPRAGPR